MPKSDEEIRKEFEEILDRASLRGGYDPKDVSWLIKTLLSVRQEEREALREEVKRLELSETFSSHYHLGFRMAVHAVLSLLDKK